MYIIKIYNAGRYTENGVHGKCMDAGKSKM